MGLRCHQGSSGSWAQGVASALPLKLTQDAHVISALLLVYLDEVVKRVREILEQSVLLVHLQPKDAVQELGDGAVCGCSWVSGLWCHPPNCPWIIIFPVLPVLTLLHIQAARSRLSAADAHRQQALLHVCEGNPDADPGIPGHSALPTP